MSVVDKYKHRGFWYHERKFNSLGRSGLIEYFKTKADMNKIRDMFLKKGWELRIQVMKAVKTELEKKYWEDEKEDIIPLVDMILSLTEEFDITNVEAFAIWCWVLHDMKDKKLVGHWRTGVKEAKQRANDLRKSNWDAFMRILKYAT